MNILSLLKKSESDIITDNDLTPKGVSKSIYPEKHGSIDQFNEAWHHIYSQTRNLKITKKDENSI
jgi:hypothetical protein